MGTFIKSNIKILACISVISIAISLDLVAKYKVFDFILPYNNGIYSNSDVFKVCNFLNLITVRNTGISFGMFSEVQNSNVIIIGLNMLIVFFLLLIMLEQTSLLKSMAISFIAGGAIGNICDRIMFGSVRDFIDLHVANYHWPTFNLADSFICAGVIIYLLHEMPSKRKMQGSQREVLTK